MCVCDLLSSSDCCFLFCLFRACFTCKVACKKVHLVRHSVTKIIFMLLLSFFNFSSDFASFVTWYWQNQKKKNNCRCSCPMNRLIPRLRWFAIEKWICLLSPNTHIIHRGRHTHLNAISDINHRLHCPSHNHTISSHSFSVSQPIILFFNFYTYKLRMKMRILRDTFQLKVEKKYLMLHRSHSSAQTRNDPTRYFDVMWWRW